MKIFYLYNLKIALLTPSLPSIFTDEFSPTDCSDNCGQETYYHIEKKLPTAHKTIVWENCLGPLDTTACIVMSFMQQHENLLMNCYVKQRPSDPLPPPYLYIVKIENFHPVLTQSLSYKVKKYIVLKNSCCTFMT